MYTENQFAEFPHLRLWEELYGDGWRTDIGYGPAKYQSKVPKSSGIYLFSLIKTRWSDHPLPDGRVAYVGKSLNLFRRHTGHEVRPIIRGDVGSDFDIDFWFKRLAPEEISSAEVWCIKKYDPLYNIIHRVRGILAHG
jgi:excinuclease UvrABC nuclease subunit